MVEGSAPDLAPPGLDHDVSYSRTHTLLLSMVLVSFTCHLSLKVLPR